EPGQRWSDPGVLYGAGQPRGDFPAADRRRPARRHPRRADRQRYPSRSAGGARYSAPAGAAGPRASAWCTDADRHWPGGRTVPAAPVEPSSPPRGPTRTVATGGIGMRLIASLLLAASLPVGVLANASSAPD